MADQASTTVSPLFARYEPRNGDAKSTPCDVQMTEATGEDVREIARLFAARQGLSVEQATQRVRRWFDEPRDAEKTFIARHDGRIVGYGRIAYIRKMTEPEFADVHEGGYLTGVVIDETIRRRGIATVLTRHRLGVIAEKGAREAFYFANSLNTPSIDLHERLGFRQIAEHFRFPGASFSGGGIGLLFRINLKETRS